MKKQLSQAGMTLIEVLISMLIFSIGALGVLGMFTTTLYLNMDARQSSEATVVANWFLEQVQILPLNDPRIVGCAPPNGCYADVDAVGGALLPAPSTTVRTTTMSELQGDVPYGVRYQIHWIREDGTGAPIPAGMAHYRVTVFWPRQREKRALDPADTGFVECFTTQALCRRLVMHTYR